MRPTHEARGRVWRLQWSRWYQREQCVQPSEGTAGAKQSEVFVERHSVYGTIRGYYSPRRLTTLYLSPMMHYAYDCRRGWRADGTIGGGRIVVPFSFSRIFG